MLTISEKSEGKTVHVTLNGELDAESAKSFRGVIEGATGGGLDQLVLHLESLTFMASAGLRVLIFAKQKLGSSVKIYVVSPQPPVLDTLEKTGFVQSVYVVTSWPA